MDKLEFKQFLLNEGVLDNRVTIMSRVILNNIKQHEDELKKLPPGGNFQFMFRKTTSGTMAMQRSARYLGLVSNSGKLEVPEDKQDLFPNTMIYIGVGEPSHRGYLDRANDVLFVQTNIPLLDNGQFDYNAFLPMLKAVLRHELEHSQQNDEAPFTRMQTHAWPSVDRKAPWDVSFSDPDSIEAYLTHPSEIEAWVSGLYKYAKTSKIPFSQIVDQQLNRIRKSMIDSRIDNVVVEDIISKVKAKWLDYVKFRFPKVKLI